VPAEGAVASDNKGEVRWNALFDPELARQAVALERAMPRPWDCPNDALRTAIGALVLERGRARASAYLHELANKVRRTKPVRNALFDPRFLPKELKPRRGQPPLRDIRQHALRFLKEQEEQGEGEPKLTFREFGRSISEEAKHRGYPPPYKSLAGYAAALGKKVREIRAERNGGAKP
jgi:hypothetical protein